MRGSTQAFLFLITLICILMSQKVLAQSNDQVTTNELKSLYENGEFKKAISYIKQFENTKDGSALIILGDCCWKESYIEEKQSNQLYTQSQMTQMMAISQGLDYDNSFALFLYQQTQQAVLKLRLQTVDLYSKASHLGYESGNQRLAYINSILGNQIGTNIPTYSGSSSSQYNPSNSTYQKSTTKCSMCNGTGFVDGSVAAYGNTSQKWCDGCGKMMSPTHCHGCKICPSCGGKGNR